MLKILLILSMGFGTSIYAQTNMILQPQAYNQYQQTLIEQKHQTSVPVNNQFIVYDSDAQKELNSLDTYANAQNRSMGLPVITLAQPSSQSLPTIPLLTGPSYSHSNGYVLPKYGNNKRYQGNTPNNPYITIK